MKKNKLIAHIILSLSLVIFTSIVSLYIGLNDISVTQIFLTFKNFLSESKNNTSTYFIIFHIRLPRILLAAITGAALSLNGLIFQSILKNPLAEPYLLGISSGSALGVVVFMTFGLGSSVLYGAPIAAFIGGILTVSIVFYIIPWMLFKNRISLSSDLFILSGVIMSFLSSSLIILIISFSEDSHLQKIFYWLMGSLSLSDYTKVFSSLPYLLLIFPFILYYAKPLNVIQISDESALSLGVNPFKIKRYLLVATSILTSAVVAVSGTIGFVGLIIPHFIKMIFGYDHRINIILTPIYGAVFMISADMITRFFSSNIEVPVGAVTTILGVPSFIYILIKKKQ